MPRYRKLGFPIVTVIFTLLGVCWVWPEAAGSIDPDSPWDNVPPRLHATNHNALFEGKIFNDGPSVTRACLECHPQTSKEVQQTSHWLWLGPPEVIAGHKEPVRIGKRNLINNFCISIEGNWPRCTVCHAGYGWKDANFDFSQEDHVDCLVCHDRSGTYSKTLAGQPHKEVDLLAVAKSVGRPSRDNCGWCHFNGGGGNAVKHGDLDGSLAKPVERIDVHMGGHDMQCVDCHQTHKHDIPGRMISVSANNTIQLNCEDCHAKAPHDNLRINAHLASLACQTCHVPVVAKQEPTKVAWDWSTAGRDIEGADQHRYLKQKGSFEYTRGLIPEYLWFNGSVSRYLKGDPIDPEKVTHLNKPRGDIKDPTARIWPFKIHRAKQPYDEKYKILIVPKTYGEGGYWTDYDWQQAARLGAEDAQLPFSGELGFAETDMHWTLTHMISPKEDALQCIDCHNDNGRMDWPALGYDSDPALVGGREYRRIVEHATGIQPGKISAGERKP